MQEFEHFKSLYTKTKAQAMQWCTLGSSIGGEVSVTPCVGGGGTLLAWSTEALALI